MYNSHRYMFENVPNLLGSDVWKNSITELIKMLITCRQQQNQFDSCYVKFCETVTTEMDTFLKYSNSSQKVRKKNIKITNHTGIKGSVVYV